MVWLEPYINLKIKKWCKAHAGCHDLHRFVGSSGRMLVWCRRCSGCTRCALRGKDLKQMSASHEQKGKENNDQTNRDIGRRQKSQEEEDGISKEGRRERRGKSSVELKNISTKS